tara:strand:+ start:291 stop:695 length:405 start_codon:yes stop_codon:yes gene_type:complete
MSETVHQGRCLCGAVRFTATGQPLSVVHCHCQSCRGQTSAPVATFAIYPRQRFAITEGTAKAYASSPGVKRSFCAACGAPLTYESEKRAEQVDVLIGAFDEPGAFTPEEHVYYAEKVSWLEIADHLPRHDDGGG